MTVADIKRILGAEVHCGEDMMDHEVRTACGSDMMSDVLAFVKDQSVLLTGLVNSQVIRTAEMMDMVCVVFVRGKTPPANIITLAENSNVCVLTTDCDMFHVCALLSQSGMEAAQ